MPYLRQRFLSLYRLAALLAFAAMLAPLWVMFVHHPVQTMQIQKPLSMAMAMQDCGMSKMEMAKLPTSAKSEKQVPASKAPACSICQAMHLLAGVALTDAGSAMFPPEPLIARSGVVEALTLKQIVAPDARPRAPPSLIQEI